jgi:hypothetical protein
MSSNQHESRPSPAYSAGSLRRLLFALPIVSGLLGCDTTPKLDRSNPMERALNKNTIAAFYARDARQLLLEELLQQPIEVSVNLFARDWKSSCEVLGDHKVRCTCQTTRTQVAGVFSAKQLHSLYSFSIVLIARNRSVVDVSVCLTWRGLRADGSYIEGQESTSCVGV